MGRKSRNARGGGAEVNPQDEGRSHACIGTLSGIGFFGGIFMIIVGNSFGGQCTMQIIDTALVNKEEGDEEEGEASDEPLGNLPSWFVYAGTVFLLCSLWACCSVGAIPKGLRTTHPVVGGCIADCLGGGCGKALLIALFVVAALCNLIGSLWLHLARLDRTPENSRSPHAPNYCHPVLWNSAWIITYFFWVAIFFSAIALVANFYTGIKFGRNVVLDARVVTKQGKLGEIREKETARMMGEKDIFIV